MGDREKASLRLQFNPQIRLEFHGATITSDAGLLAFRELDDALDLTPIASDYLRESRSGRNIRHHLVPLLRQSIYSRLAGYDDTNDAERLAQDPAMRVVVGWQGSDRNAASSNTVSRFETETLTQEDNLQGLARMNTQWVEDAMARTAHQRVILDLDSSESPVRARPAGGCRLQWALRVCLLSSPLSIQPVRGLRRSDATIREQVIDLLVTHRHLIPVARKGHYLMMVPHV